MDMPKDYAGRTIRPGSRVAHNAFHPDASTFGTVERIHRGRTPLTSGAIVATVRWDSGQTLKVLAEALEVLETEQ